MPAGSVAITLGSCVAIGLAAAFGGGKWAVAVAVMAVAIFLIAARTRFALYFVAALIPIQVTLDIAGLNVLPTLLGAYGILAVTAARALCGQKSPSDPSRLTLILFFFAAAATAAAALGLDPVWSLTRLIHLGAYLSLTASAIILLRTVDDAVRVIRIVMAVSVVVGLMGIVFHSLQFVVGHDAAERFLTETVAPVFLGGQRVAALQAHKIWDPGIPGAPMRAVGPFMWPPVFAMYIELVLPLWLAVLLYGRGAKALWPAVAAGILIFCVAATFVRGAWLTFPIAALAMWYAAARAGLRAKPAAVLLLGLGVLVVSFASVMAGEGAFAERLRTAWQPDYASNLQRFEIWTDAAEIAKEHPILGVGPGNFSAARYGERASELERPHVNAHNMYFTITCELGLVGLAAFVVFYFRLLGCAVAAGRCLADRTAKILCVGLVGSFVWIGLNSLTDDALYEHRLFGIFWILAACVAVMYRGARAAGADPGSAGGRDGSHIEPGRPS
jgi:O-antigen ligase